MEKVHGYLLGSAISILIIAVAFSATAQPTCDIKYFVVNSNSEIVPGPLVSPGYYTVWTGLGSSLDWWTQSQFLFEGGHKYLIMMANLPENGGSVYLDEDTADLASYPFPTQDMAAIYYVNDDENDVYKVTVCP